ncbi:cysteine desulfurase [Candidatus Falkowbacteria bacterium]|nr:cysteine desulfurase [Candidatus Falkowbacteria bacterium]
MKKQQIYLDYSATTPVDPVVLKAMTPFFSKKFANPASLYKKGLEAREALELSRLTIARAINAEAGEIIFTSSATESNNFALKGVAFAHLPALRFGMASKSRGKHIIISAIEHDCVLASAAWLQKQGFELTIINPEKNGVIDSQKIKNALRPDTILVSVMAVNNELGTIQPISEIGKICRSANVYFHTDAAQAFGKIPLDVRAMNIDLLTLSSHKIYGPKGVGCLFIRKGVKMEPTMHGGGQEFHLRSGTVNVAGIVGFAKAAEIAVATMRDEQQRISGLANKLIAGIKSTISNVELNADVQNKVPNILNLQFSFIEGESLLMLLDLNGIQVSTGSACSSEKLKPSHVLMACGLRPEQAHGSVRFSIGRFTTEQDIDRVLEILPKVVNDLRKISPLK